MPKPMDDDALTELLDLGFAFLCTRQVGELVDVDRLFAAVDETVTESRVSRFHERFVAPARERLLSRAHASEIVLGAWLPDHARTKIADLLGAPMPIPKQLIDEAVTNEKVRDQIRDMLRDTLMNFVSKVTGGAQGGGGGSGLMGAIGFGARAFGAAGKSLLGGLGEELQKQMQERAREFVDGAVAGVQDRIARRLADPKTAEDLGKRRKKGFLQLLEKTEAEAARVIDRAPHAEIDALVASIVVHNVKRKELRDAVKAELEVVLAELQKETIGGLLDEAGAREIARLALHRHGLPLLRDMCKTPAFEAWWSAR